MIHIKTQIQIRKFHFLFLSYRVECWEMLTFYHFCLQLSAECEILLQLNLISHLQSWCCSSM